MMNKNMRSNSPGTSLGKGSDMHLKQHGGEGKNLNSKSGKAGLNRGMEGPEYCGPGRYL